MAVRPTADPAPPPPPLHVPPGDDEPDAAQTALTGIGQWNVSATPLQMALVMSAIAHDGVAMKPYVVDQVLSADLDVLSRTDGTEGASGLSSPKRYLWDAMARPRPWLRVIRPIRSPA